VAFVIIRNTGMDDMAIEAMPVPVYGCTNARQELVS